MAELWQDVLDRVDDVTADLILQLQLQDSNEHEQQQMPSPDADGMTHDFNLARSLYQNDLELYRSLRAHRRGFTPPANDHSPSKTFLCIICEDNFDDENGTQTPCAHWYCGPCLDGLFNAALKHEDAYPPRCCGQEVDIEQVLAFLDPALAAEFVSKKEELDDTRRIYCWDPKCSTYIGQSGRKGDVARCPECDQTTCRLCKQKTHDSDCMQDSAVEQTLKLADKEEWRRCYSCERIVELRSGCNHITQVSHTADCGSMLIMS